MNVSKAQVLSAKEEDDDPWAVGNQALYDLCAKYPKHTNYAEIVAKIWIIGKTYSAALDRGRGRGPHGELSNDEFYTTVVPAGLKQIEIDESLGKLRKRGASAWSEPTSVLELHGRLTAAFQKLAGKDHRSLASKYLHFHCPSVFFIFDERAVGAAQSLMPRRVRPLSPHGDRQYAVFATRALAITRHIGETHGIAMTPRQLDRLLLARHAALESRARVQ
jgi:hypothetical protein